MKKITLLFILITFLTIVSYSQNTDLSEVKKLNQEVINLYKAGNLEAAIKISEKLIKIEKKSNSSDKMNLAIITANTARMKKEMFQKLVRKMKTEKMNRNDYLKIFKQSDKYAIKAEEDFKDAIRIFDDLKSDSNQAAFAKSQYAWLLYNHRGKPDRKIVIDPTKPERYEEAEKMYLESLASYDKTLGKDADLSIIAVFDIAEFYLNWSKFEDSIPFYERFIQTVEKKYGKNQVSLTPALRSLADILVMTDRDAEANKLADRITAITGKKEPLPRPNFNLQLRKKYSASIGNQILISKVTAQNNLGDVTSRQGLLRGGEFAASGTQYTYSDNASISIRNRSVWVQVTIDEEGNVIDADPVESKNSDADRTRLEKEARDRVKDWKFKPFVYQGKARKMRAFVAYVSSKVST
jgi:tetratricopeptide (TPR) repeat protein